MKRAVAVLLCSLLLLGTYCPPNWETITVPVHPVETDTTASRARIVGIAERIALAHRLAPETHPFGAQCTPTWARHWTTGIPLLKTGHTIRVCVDSSGPADVLILLSDAIGTTRGLRPSADSIKQTLLDSLTRLGAVDRSATLRPPVRNE